jgi:ribosomal protein S18 acetylase RimI-like enzyme
MLIREATTNDAVQIALVQASSSQEAYKGILPAKEITDEFIESRAHVWEEFVRSEETRIYVYEHEHTVIGFIHFGPCRDADLKLENTGEIWAMYVTPLHWRTGAGSQLMNKALNEIAKLEFVTVSLWVLKENKNAIEFYQKVGFRPDGTVKAHNTGAEEIRMVKRI